MCTVNLNDCWHYHKAERDNLVWFFSFEHDPTFDAGLPVKLNARIVL